MRSVQDRVIQGLGVRLENIPAALTARPQWVTWKVVDKGRGPTKVPFSTNGELAKPNDSTTWTSFEAARAIYMMRNMAGLGYVFSAGDPFVGIDLDSCRNPTTGTVASWAREIILAFNSYAEVSPSQTGIKIFAVGELPDGKGMVRKLPDAEMVSDKIPAIEVYDRLRYFALTGHRLQHCPHDPQSRQNELDALLKQYRPEPKPTPPRRTVGATMAAQPVLDRAARYLAAMPPAVSGSFGHNQTFSAACTLVLGFDISPDDAWPILAEWNQRCCPPWSEHDLRRKLDQADKQGGARGYLLRTEATTWQR